MPPRTDRPRPAITIARDPLTSTTWRFEHASGASRRPSSLVRWHRVTKWRRGPLRGGSREEYARAARVASGRGGARAARRAAEPAKLLWEMRMSISRREVTCATQPEGNAAWELRNPRPPSACRRGHEARLRGCAGIRGPSIRAGSWFACLKRRSPPSRQQIAFDARIQAPGPLAGDSSAQANLALAAHKRLFACWRSGPVAAHSDPVKDG